MKLRRHLLKAHPATIVLASFLGAIMVGTLLLKLPISTRIGFISWIDALFTATSAVCVTGLVVQDTGQYFTVFGQCVILLMIQIGGLGVMTISVTLFRLMGRSISFRQRLVMQDLFAHTPRKDIFGLLRSIMLFTFGAELLGAVFLTIHWSDELPWFQAMYTAVFHSVSAFCNAGFALFSDSFMRYDGNLLLNFSICGLIVAGGIGFTVLYDIQSWFTNRARQRTRLSVHTRTVLWTTLVLILVGAGVFGFLEWSAAGENSVWSERLLTSVFQSITCRTAGFNTVDISALQDATLTMMIFLMFIGASPGSCGGGVKTTSLALLAAYALSRMRGARRVNLCRKSVPEETVNRSISLILLSITIIGVVLFMILMGSTGAGRDGTDVEGTFRDYFFETVSAFGTVGLSTGVTPHLNLWCKCWIILMMIVGRVGVLTFSYIIIRTRAMHGIEYSEENLMVG